MAASASRGRYDRAIGVYRGQGPVGDAAHEGHVGRDEEEALCGHEPQGLPQRREHAPFRVGVPCDRDFRAEEVGDPAVLRADDDDYGILTLLVQLDFEPREFFKIPPGCFSPEPDVDSACVVLDRRAQPLLPENLRAAFVKIVKRAFSQRRKMMLKLLKADWPKEKLEAAFADLKISPQERAEKLNLEQFVALAKSLAENK